MTDTKTLGPERTRERKDAMKRFKLTPALHTLAIAGASSLLMTGCIMNKEEGAYNSDGQAAYVTSEVDQMGQVYDQIPGTAAAKIGGGLAITGELVVEPFAYKADCECFVRRATFDGIRGYERDRVDSVTLLDSNGATMDAFKPALISRILHKRHVVKSKNGREADIHFEFTADIKSDAGVKKGVWNGAMTGTYNGQEFKSGSVTKVTRVWEGGRFGFPESGGISLDRPVFGFLVEFLGDGKAKATITNKVNKKVHVLWVDKDYNESDAAEQP
jgi:hypothetical protein